MGCTLLDFGAASRPRALAGVRAVLFDLDGTLVDVLRAKAAAAEAAAWTLADAGLDLDVASAAQDLLAFARVDGIDREDVVERWLALRVGERDRDLAARARAAFEAGEATGVRAYPRARGTLRELARRGLDLALVTDAPRAAAQRRLAAAGLAEAFRVVVTGDDTPAGKADARPYALATARLGVDPARALMVGDNPARDVRSARVAGCRAALAAYGFQASIATLLVDAQPDLVLARIDDLLAALP